MNVYITATGRYLPGPPIDNEQIEDHLGRVHGKSSRLKKKILASNGIQTRHYAIDNQQRTWISNTEMAAEAVRACLQDSHIYERDISLLSCATSQGDFVLPGFASLVQAELQLAELEIHSAHGICSSSLMAMKTAYSQLACNEHQHALVVASEFCSRLFKASRYEALNENTTLDFNAEFLRWMLSDGAGACLLQTQKHQQCLRIDWIKSFSHADAYPTCMSVGRANKEESLTWQDYSTYAEAEAAGALLLRQDVRLLDNIVKLGVDGFLRLINEKRIQPADVDHVLCHYSSDYFRSRIFELMHKAGVAIPEEKWYTNLYTRGNTGCAAIFIMLDEFRRTKNLQSGEQIICMVPESGRFNTAYMKLTVVDENDD